MLGWVMNLGFAAGPDLSVSSGRNTISGAISQVVGAGDKIRITARRTKGANTLLTLADGSAMRVTWKRS